MYTKTQISTILDELSIEALAIETKFHIHSDYVITAKAFVLSFFLMISVGSNTLNSWTAHLSKLVKHVLSEGGLRSKLSFRHLPFVKTLLNRVLEAQLSEAVNESQPISPLLIAFNRVFAEDSTCLKLPDTLSSSFPGAHSKTKSLVATARIQCRVDLKSNKIHRLEVQSFRDNDQKFSGDIINEVQDNDLILRDLGYWSLKVFKKIIQKNAYILSRLRYGTNLYHPSGERIDLHQVLKKAKKNKQQVVTLSVLVGKEAQLPLRLVAIRVPDNIAQQRKRKAKNDRSQKTNHSKAYMDLLEWSLLVTNVPKEVWTPQQMLRVYGYRWRIEIIFKCWKSHFDFEHLFRSKKSISPPRAIISLYLLLIWITLCFNPLFNFAFVQAYRIKAVFISILKFAKFFKEHFVDCMNILIKIYNKRNLKDPDLLFFIQLVAKRCHYDKKNKISNYCQNLYMLNFNTR